MGSQQHDRSGRLSADLLKRFVEFGTRVLKLAQKLEQDHRPRRVVDQIVGSGTSPGAHIFEAHAALSTADFLKLIGGAAKELNETLYWLGLIEGMQWEPPERLTPLIDETLQLISICKAMNARTRKRLR